MAQGYWKANEETAQRFRQNGSSGPHELYTGDLCRLDEEGFIYFIGRKDDQLKHKGFRISPLEIEAAACDISGVSEAGLVQSEDDGLLHLFITVTGQNITVEKVVEELQTRLESFKVPDKAHIVYELPKTNNGKLDRTRLNDQINRSSSCRLYEMKGL